jgi:hypothetical protein
VASQEISGEVEAGATLEGTLAWTTTGESGEIESGSAAIDFEFDEDPTGWSANILLREGSNTIRIQATDRVGNTHVIRRTIILDTRLPQISYPESRWVQTKDADGNPVEFGLIVFDEYVKVDSFFDLIVFDEEGGIVAGSLKPDLFLDQPKPSYWASFKWTPGDPLTASQTYYFSVPEGVQDLAGNKTEEEMLGEWPIEEGNGGEGDSDPVPTDEAAP